MEGKGKGMSIYEAILGRRSIRKFKQEKISIDILEKLINSARTAPSAANLQPVEYIIINDSSICKKIFCHLNWAAYIKPEGNPLKGEEPVAYICFLINKEIAREKNYKIDCGAAAQNLILAAYEEGIGSCIIASLNKAEVSSILKVGGNFEIEFIIALGYPLEQPIMEDTDSSNIKYYKDSSGVLHVPKRPLDKILHYNSF